LLSDQHRAGPGGTIFRLKGGRVMVASRPGWALTM
jgi:hypothetical protein